MSCVVSIHKLSGTLAGTGILVRSDLVLTCAHVVNNAIGRDVDEAASPDANARLHIRFAISNRPDPIEARVDDGPDAWRAPPADSTPGADLCILKLSRSAPEAATIAQLMPMKFKPIDVRVSGYPQNWNEKGERGIDSVAARVQEEDGSLWLIRGDPTSRLLAMQSKKRPAGAIYSGFSGGPVALHDGLDIIGMAARAREHLPDGTAYAIPAVSFPPRLLPSRSTSGPSQAAQFAYFERIEEELGTVRAPIPRTTPDDTTIMRRQWPLSEIFVPLELQSAQEMFGGEIDWARVIPNPRTVLVGEAGSGKSTLLRHLALSAIDLRSRMLGNSNGNSIAGDGQPVPVLARIPVWLNLPTMMPALRQDGMTNWPSKPLAQNLAEAGGGCRRLGR